MTKSKHSKIGTQELTTDQQQRFTRLFDRVSKTDSVVKELELKVEGQEIEAELGRLTVRENRGNPSSNLIELAFVRLKSTSATPGYPVVYLDGGPGSSAINIAQVPDYARAFLKLREVGDVILLDQRRY